MNLDEIEAKIYAHLMACEVLSSRPILGKPSAQVEVDEIEMWLLGRMAPLVAYAHELEARERPKTTADRIHEGKHLLEKIEFDIDEWLGFDCVRITTDDYDNSIEIYLDKDAPDDWRADEAFKANIRGLGFDRFWVRWPDGSEQCGVGERLPKPKPSTVLAAVQAQEREG